MLPLLLLLSTEIFAKDMNEQQFWEWFKKNETVIFDFESNREVVFERISEALKSYKHGLAFEISKEIDGKREFVISADGVIELFPAVKVLKTASPDLERWSVTAFRPRLDDYSGLKLKFEGGSVDASKIWFEYQTDNSNFYLKLYHPSYTEEHQNVYINTSYILLDKALGEYDVTTGIKYIEHGKLPEDPKAIGLLPFVDLRSVFDRLKSG